MNAKEIKNVLALHIKWLSKEPTGARADLSGAYLRGADLCLADLGDANLSGAYLRGADLSGANLSGTTGYTPIDK